MWSTITIHLLIIVIQSLIDQLHGSCFLWAFLNEIWTRILSMTLFSTLETNNVASHYWFIISLSFPTVLSSVRGHSYSISTSDCVGPDNIFSSLVCTHCVRLIMAALCNRGGALYFCPVFFFYLSFYLFSSPKLSCRRLDVYHTLIRGVALVRI